MKKLTIIFILVLITGGMSWAQSLEIYESVGGQDIKRNNGEVMIKEVKAGEPFVLSLRTKNIGAATLSVFCKKVYLNILSGSSNTFCWDVCYLQNVMVSKKPIAIKSQETITRFDATYDANEYAGDSRIRYVWFDGANTNDSTCVEVTFRSRSMGTAECQVPMNELFVAPNPANTFVKVKWNPGLINGKIVIRDVVGNTILEKQVEPNCSEVLLNTSEYRDGIYFCLFESEGSARLVKKMVVRH